MAKPNSRGMLPNGRRGRSGPSFAALPHWIMESDDYKGLGNSAKALLFELIYQFRGNNNGNLTIAMGVLKKRGWKARGTVEAARDELLAADLIVQTRIGQFANPGGVCALFALRWIKIDEQPGRFELDEVPLSKRSPRKPK